MEPVRVEASPAHVLRAQPRRVANVVVETLAELGVKTFYGIPGGAISSIYDALLDQPSGQTRVLNTRHETGAVFMAMGHSRANGGLPAVLATSGPGITNALTGLAAAQADGIPLVMIGGEVARKNFGRGALQEGSRYELDVLGMVRSVTKFSAEITSGRSAPSIVRKAVATALSGRQGPVFLSLPLDVANQEIIPTTAGGTEVRTEFRLDDQLIDEAAQALQGSRRGLILVGSGARHPEAVRWVGTLASTLQIPVATTPKAKGLFPESDPLALGIYGLAGHPSASEYVDKGVDVLLCIGCGLGENGTNSWTDALKPTDAFIQVDIDAAQIGRNYHVDLGLVGPAHLVLRQLVSRVERVPLMRLPNGVRHHPVTEASEDGALQPAEVIRTLQSVMPEETIYTSDIGEHCLFALHYLRITRPENFVIHSGLGSMGSGIGSAIGVKVARPERPVVSICGDHGFQMSGMELATCVENEVGVIFAIFNDARMRMVEAGQTHVFGRPGKMDSPRVDFAGLARAVGATGHTLRTLEDLRKLAPDLQRVRGPVVLDIQLSSEARFPKNGRVSQIRNFNSNA